MRGLLRRLKLALTENLFARNVAVLAGGAFLGQGLIVVATPFLTRLYVPDDFGVLAVYASMLSILAVVVALSYEQAIPLPEDDETAVNLLALVVGIVLFMSLLVGFVLWLVGHELVQLVNTPALEPYLWLVPPGLLGAGLYQAFNLWAVRRKTFAHIARTKITQAVGMTLVQICLGFLKFGPGGLLLGYAVGKTAGGGTLAALAWRHDKQVISRVSGAGIRWAAGRYRRFPIFTNNASLLNSLGLFLPPILLAAFYGPQVAGWFALGQRVVGLPMSLVSISVGDVYLGEAAQLARTDPAALKRLFMTTAKRLILLGALPIAAVAVSGSWIFALVFGEQWQQAGVYVQLMSVMFLAQFVVSPLIVTTMVLEQQPLALVWNVGRVTLVLGSLVVAYWAQLAPATAVGLYSASMLAAYLTVFVLCRYLLRKRWEEWKALQ